VVFALVAHVDGATETAVRAVWARVAEAGLARPPTDAHVPPHLTLWVSESVQQKLAPDLLDRFAERTRPFEVRFRSVGSFPARWGPVFFAPVPTADLLDLHRESFTLAMDLGAMPQWHQRPAHWVPHLTATLELEEGKVAEAVAICAAAELPEASTLTSVGLYRTLPSVELVHRVGLTGR